MELKQQQLKDEHRMVENTVTNSLEQINQQKVSQM